MDQAEFTLNQRNVSHQFHNMQSIRKSFLWHVGPRVLKTFDKGGCKDPPHQISPIHLRHHKCSKSIRFLMGVYGWKLPKRLHYNADQFNLIESYFEYLQFKHSKEVKAFPLDKSSIHSLHIVPLTHRSNDSGSEIRMTILSLQFGLCKSETYLN